MKIKKFSIHLFLLILLPNGLNAQIKIIRNSQVSKENANKNWSKEFTLFDFITDEPIFPLNRNGIPVYKIYYSSYDDPRPYFGEFTISEVEKLKYLKFKNRETCLKFCFSVPLKSKPNITTLTVTSVSINTATSGGVISSDGGAAVISSGVVWSTTPNPIILLTTKTSDGTGMGTFVSNLTNLIPNTTYYIRAFATNIAGTAYGEERVFTTLPSETNKFNIEFKDTVVSKGTFFCLNAYVTNFTKLIGVQLSVNYNTQKLIYSKVMGFNPLVEGLSGSFTHVNNSNNKTAKIKMAWFDDGLNGATISGTGILFQVCFIAGNADGQDTIKIDDLEAIDVLENLVQTNTNSSIIKIGVGENSNVEKPIITTNLISFITTTTATSGGFITTDGGAVVITRGVIWSTTPNPTISLSTKTTNGTGNGTFTSTLTNLTPNTTYYIRAYATNSSGTAYGNELTFTTTNLTTGVSCPGTPTVKDIDGNTYNTVQIGDQCWTKENLRTTRYRDGTLIPLDESGGTEGSDQGQTWSNRKDGARTVYAHDANNLKTYGYLYNWSAAFDSKGICPLGWHISNDKEWTLLENSLGGSDLAGGKMKSFTSWDTLNISSKNEIEFSGMPGGYRQSTGFFYGIGQEGYWLCPSDDDYPETWNRKISSHNSMVARSSGYFFQSGGFSVRCIKDTGTSKVAIPILTTISVSAISYTTGTSGGNITLDGGSPVTSRGLVWSTTTKPTISLTSKTMDGLGTGSFVSKLTNLVPNKTYYIRAYATNSAGTAYGNELSFTTTSSLVMNIPCPGITTIKDIDGNTYNTVQIGNQCWTKENLRVTKYLDGSVIPLDESGGTEGNGADQKWSSRTSGARTIYKHSTSNLVPYGYLYNWYSVTDTKGICPKGWHVPSESDWNILGDYLGTDAGFKLADTSWILAFGKSTNESGFSVKPGGYRDTSGRFSTSLISGNFWSTSKINSNLFLGTELYSKGYWSNFSYYGASGLSIRCLKDTNSTVSIPTITSTGISAITSTSATSGGNINNEGGSFVTTRGVVWSTTPNPNISLTTKTTDGSGNGTFTSTLTNLTPNTTYYIRAYATNSEGTAYGNELKFTTTNSLVINIPCPGIPTVKDIDGNTYTTVQIGNQCWTKENLRTTRYRDGFSIPLDISGNQAGNILGETWTSRTSGARTVYEHNANNLATYGYLYNRLAAISLRGICPSDWHLPSDSEWETLIKNLGGENIAAGKIKNTTGWQTSNTGVTNESGFSGLPGGYRSYSNGRFNGINGSYWWSSSEVFSSIPWLRYIYYSLNNSVSRSFEHQNSGLSIRCLRY